MEWCFIVIMVTRCVGREAPLGDTGTLAPPLSIASSDAADADLAPLVSPRAIPCANG